MLLICSPHARPCAVRRASEGLQAGRRATLQAPDQVPTPSTRMNSKVAQDWRNGMIAWYSGDR